MRKGGLRRLFGFFALYFYFSKWEWFTTPTWFGVYLLWNVGVGVASNGLTHMFPLAILFLAVTGLVASLRTCRDSAGGFVL
jgi:hypothetical protein